MNETMKHKSGKQFETATEIDTVLPTPDQYSYGESTPTPTTSTGAGEFIESEGRSYINPQVGLDESNAFIENLRRMQAADTERINQQTYALGTQVPSNLGGLAGAETTFAERYQTPQTEQMVANLRATAQTQALNQALENTLAQYKERYNQAYRNAYAKAMTPKSSTQTEDDGLQIDTETKTGGTYLTPSQIVPGGISSDTRSYELEYESSDDVIEGINRLNSLIGSGRLPNLGGVGITYQANGREYPAVVYVNNGQIVGVETPFFSYRGDTGQDFLKSTVADGGRIKNAGGVDITTGWQWRVTH